MTFHVSNIRKAPEMDAVAEAATSAIEITHERGYEIIDGLANPVRTETRGMLTVAGRSIEFGLIYVVIEHFAGTCLLLPIASQTALA